MSHPPADASTPSVFLPAADIPRFVALGSVSLGITGQDVIAESTHAEEITELLLLGFGKCALQVQVPVEGHIEKVEDLAGGRIATSFEVLAGAFFKQIDQSQGRSEDKATKVEYVGGSVEAACALGMADGIGESVYQRLRLWADLSSAVDLVGQSFPCSKDRIPRAY